MILMEKKLIKLISMDFSDINQKRCQRRGTDGKHATRALSIFDYGNKKLRRVSIVRNRLWKQKIRRKPRSEQSVYSKVPFKSHVIMVKPSNKFIVSILLI